MPFFHAIHRINNINSFKKKIYSQSCILFNGIRESLDGNENCFFFYSFKTFCLQFDLYQRHNKIEFKKSGFHICLLKHTHASIEYRSFMKFIREFRTLFVPVYVEMRIKKIDEAKGYRTSEWMNETNGIDFFVALVVYVHCPFEFAFFVVENIKKINSE